MTNELFTFQDYADRVQVSRAYLYKLIGKGKIQPVKRGKKKYIDATKADTVLKFQPAARQVPLKPKINGSKKKTTNRAEALDPMATRPEQGMDILELERIKTYQQARKLQLENDVKDGLLVDASEAKKLFFETGRNIRDSILNIPARVAPLAVKKSQHEIEMLIMDELKKALSSLSNDIID